MRAARPLWLLGLSIACSGCALVEDSTRNVYVAFATPIEVHREKARNRRWAEAAWQEVCANGGGHSEDFAQGFKEGFAEYLFRGGNGEPPLMAPPRYREIRYQNPKGYQAIQDWFEGYRFGVSAAQSSGARRWITGPSSLHQEPHFEGPPPAQVTAAKTPPESPRTASEPAPKRFVLEPTAVGKGEPIPAVVPAADKADAVKAGFTKIGSPEVAGPIREAPPDEAPLPDAVRVRLRAIILPSAEPTRVRIKAIAPAVE